MKRIVALLRGLAFATPAVAVFFVLAPVACGRMDITFGIRDAIPRWLQPLGGMLMVAGTSIALWTLVLFAVIGDGTPNPLAPPRNLVRAGPFRYSRNPMMLGGWFTAFGLSLLLRSLSYLVLCVVVVLVGAVYVVVFEEPSLLRRFGRAYADYCEATPRWLGHRHV